MLFAALAACSFLASEPTLVRDWRVIAPLDERGRRAFNPSAVLAHHLLDRNAPPPIVGEKLLGERGVEQPWERRTADANGSVSGAPIAAACALLEWPRSEVVLADLDGATTLWVNGTPQVGDVYGDGIGGLPVALNKGTNRLVVTGVRGSFRLALSTPSAPLIANPFDATLPDLVVGGRSWEMRTGIDAAIVVMNASAAPLPQVVVESGSADESAPFEFVTTVERAGLPPLGLRKVALRLQARTEHPVFQAPGRVTVPITVRAGDHVATTTLSLELKPALALRRQTRRSRIDDSVQEYAVLPPNDGAADSLVLTLHGAGVDAFGHAGSYSAKPDFWVVAPTNRRRFGFDWQDWGRLDAYETLTDACFRIGGDLKEGTSSIDPTRPHRRVYLTGHSMGGHGTWHLAANDPATFAAIAPSAGWSSFDSYGGRPAGALAELWQAADGASRTLSLIDNLKQLPTFVLHGTADDNVPASEARLMLDALASAGAEPASHLQEGAGHWWDGDASPGADCVDWPAIFELFRSHRRSTPIHAVSFTSNDPSTQASCDWIHVEQLERYGQPFRVDATWDPVSRTGTVTTRNVLRLWLRTPDLADVATWTLDGATPATTAAERKGRDQKFERREGRWRKVGGDAAVDGGWTEAGKFVSSWPFPSIGPFKRVFDDHFVLVYGTQGTPAETRELLDRARFDAAHWWYRANGRAVLVSDVQWLALDRGIDLLDDWDRPSREDRYPNVLLYGNRDSNAAWAELVPSNAPFDAARGELRLGDKRFEGYSLGACVVLPRRRLGGLVGLCADTGARGTRLGYVLTPFISGVGYPDFTLFSADVLTKGDGGVLAAGWFDSRWRVQDDR